MGESVRKISAMAKESLLKGSDHCCGGCCWFQFEDAAGWGQCCCPELDNVLNLRRCDDFCCDALYVGRDEKRRHLAVLRKFQRCLGQVVNNKDVDVKSVYDSLDFVIGYCKEV